MNPYQPPEENSKQQISDGVIWLIFLAGWFIGSCFTIYSNREMNRNAYQKGLEDGRTQMVEDFLVIPRIPDLLPYDR